MNNNFKKFGPLVGVVHIGSSSCRFLIYSSINAEILTCHEVELQQITPNIDWIEYDPVHLIDSVNECIEVATRNLRILNINPSDIIAIGITNQRETTVLWDRKTGKPLYNAIAWCDTRTSAIVDTLLKRSNNKINYLRSVCGLPISTLFSAVKVKWLIENVEEVRDSIAQKTCLFGTLDTWVLWNLTGGVENGVHLTDVTNASRTMLMNLETLEWDLRLCYFFKITPTILPSIKSSSEIFGYVRDGSLQGIPIASVIGDQQASLLGQMCVRPGQAVCSFDEGSFLLFNTAQEIIYSNNGLLSTVAFKLGANEKTFYALEGAIPNSGSIMKWLKDTLMIPIDEIKQNNTLIQRFMSDTSMISSFCSLNASAITNPFHNNNNSKYDVVFVPAFNGFYSPYWNHNARGMIMGMSAHTTSQQIIYAAYEAICYQTRQLLESLEKDCTIWPKLKKIVVGGEISENTFLLQLMADLCGIRVERPQITNSACLGAMLAAGLSTKLINLENFEISCVPPKDILKPTMNSNYKDMKFQNWLVGVRKCLNFSSNSATDIQSEFMYEPEDPIIAVRKSLPCGFFVLSSFALLILAQVLENSP